MKKEQKIICPFELPIGDWLTMIGELAIKKQMFAEWFGVIYHLNLFLTELKNHE